MPHAYRIVKARYAGNAFDGEGARLEGARWSSKGARMVYTAGSISLAILEVLVHLQQSRALSGYVIFSLEFPPRIVQEVDLSSLPANWRIFPAPATTKEIGDAWIGNSSSAVLRVPSVIVPSEHNFLINPAHRDFRSITITGPALLDIDGRLRRRLARCNLLFGCFRGFEGGLSYRGITDEGRSGQGDARGDHRPGGR